MRLGMRLENKVAIVAGAGQTPGDTIGNGRATAILFAREGARVMLVDKNFGSAKDTHAMIRDEGGEAWPFEADITREEDCKGLAAACIEHYGHIDILQNNCGVSVGDASATEILEENWDRILTLNLKGPVLTIKHVLPEMRRKQTGVITNVSSVAAIAGQTTVAYKASKAGLNALTQSIALGNARYGIRANAIMPGLMDTPMAIERRAREQKVSKEEIRAARDARVPLGGKMGTGWDTAYASLFLASDEARFITGVMLPVDGGMSVRVG